MEFRIRRLNCVLCLAFLCRHHLTKWTMSTVNCCSIKIKSSGRQGCIKKPWSIFVPMKSRSVINWLLKKLKVITHFLKTHVKHIAYNGMSRVWAFLIFWNFDLVLALFNFAIVKECLSRSLFHPCRALVPYW